MLLARALQIRRTVTLSLFVSLLFAAAATLADADLVAQGDAAWAERSTGFTTLGTVSPLPVERAIAAWEAALTEDPNDVELRFRLVEALYFWGHFAARDEETSRRAADRELALAEETYGLVTASLGASGQRAATAAEQASLERSLVDAPAAHFWCAISWGVWGMEHGRLVSARRDVASRIKRHAEVLIELDPRYADAGGLRLLGRLHTATPKVPFVTGWIDRRLGIELLRRAHMTSTRDARNALFLAEALFEHAPDRRAEAIGLLREVAARSPAPESVVEETETIDAARRRLAAEERGELP
jgi:hypothetical protein